MIKNALITGAGKRIGRAIAIRLAKSGWNVALHYNSSRDEVEKLSSELLDQGCKSVLVQADLRDTENLERVIEEAKEALGPLTCLINNAAIFEPDRIDSVSGSSLQNHMSTNLFAPTLLSKAFVEQFDEKAAEQGNIVNIVDQRVMSLRPDFLSYTLSKAALWTLTQTLAMELAPRIRVNAIGPGPTLANTRQTEAQFRQQCSGLPLGYGATEAEIADGVAFLLSAKSITGEFIAMDGGNHLPTCQVIEE
ncbi:MAG: SDR family oxidoreductase [Sneathiella sp.]